MDDKMRQEFGDDYYSEDGEDTLTNRFLTFRLGDEEYGIEIRYVIEIIGIQKIAAVPNMPVFIKGVVNLRGQVIPVMDVRTRFGMPEYHYDERTCIIVVRSEDSLIGLIVDTVKEVIDIPAENISAPPKVARGNSAKYLQGIGRVDDSVKILIAVDALLQDEEHAELSTISERGGVQGKEVNPT